MADTKPAPSPEELAKALRKIAEAHRSRNTATDKLILIGRALREIGLLDTD